MPNVETKAANLVLEPVVSPRGSEIDAVGGIRTAPDARAELKALLTDMAQLAGNLSLQLPDDADAATKAELLQLKVTLESASPRAGGSETEPT